MLRELSVQNLALIEDVHHRARGRILRLDGRNRRRQEFTVDRTSLVLGGKASTDLIRSGKTEARAAAVFEIIAPPLDRRSKRFWGVRSTMISSSSPGASVYKDEQAHWSMVCR